MKRFYIIFGLALLCFLPLNAQEMHWENVTALHYAATNGTDPKHTLQQYLLFDEATMDSNRKLFSQYKTFAEEFSKMQLNQIVPEGLKEMDKAIAELKKMLKEQPEMADIIKAQIKVVEDQKKEFAKMAGGEVEGYTNDPAELLRKLTNIAIGKKAYSAYRDIDGGLFSVQTGPCYGPLETDAFNYPETDEKYKYTWGAIDYNGNMILEPKYKGKFKCNDELDIMFLETKEKDGSIRVGARGYDGRIRIPFVYDYCEFWTASPDNGICVYSKGGKLGFVDFDNKLLLPFEYKKVMHIRYGFVVTKDGKNYGIIEDQHCRLVVPFKYKDFWDQENDNFKMQRFDGKLDVFDKDFKLIRTEDAS